MKNTKKTIITIKRNEGMTLIEVIVAILILAIVTVAMVSVFTTIVGVGKKDTDLTNTDSGLSKVITESVDAESEGYESETIPEYDSLTLGSGSDAYTIPIDAMRYIDPNNNKGFTVFGYNETP